MRSTATLSSLTLVLEPSSREGWFGLVFLVIGLGVGLGLGFGLAGGPVGAGSWGADVVRSLLGFGLGGAFFLMGTTSVVGAASELEVELEARQVRLTWRVVGLPVRRWERQLDEIAAVTRRSSLLMIYGAREIWLWHAPFSEEDIDALEKALTTTRLRASATGQGAPPDELLALVSARAVSE